MSTSPAKKNVAILLFRNDLRIHDNPLLQPPTTKTRKITHVLPIFVFDERVVELSSLAGFKRSDGLGEARSRVLKTWRCGGNRVKFLAESVFDLKASLQKLKSDLRIDYGLPETAVADLVQEIRAQGMDVEGVFAAKETTTEEITVETRLSNALSKLSPSLTLTLLQGSKTLVHPSDLPFPISQTPDVFTNFRKAVEGLGPDTMIRTPLPTPTSLPPFPSLANPTSSSTFSPPSTLSDLLPLLLKPFYSNGDVPAFPHKSSSHPFVGGESSGIDRLKHYCGRENERAPLGTYKQTRNGMVGADYSSKFSAWLGLGCLSPRMVAQEIKEWEKKWTPRGHGTKDSYWLIFELLWRDYFTFVGQKYGATLFDIDGFNSITHPNVKPPTWKYADEDEGANALKRWKEGKTGVPFIDANMNELRFTGFQSNRGRQNVACFLTKDLFVDWRAGAEVFEEELVDYDTSSNWGNWQYGAGVGTDPRDNRYFNPIKQAKDYDPNGDYIKTWIPSLASVPAEFIHHPWTMPRSNPSWNKLDDLYKSAPKEEKGSWKGHYSRKAGGQGKTGGNPSEKARGGGPGGRGGGGGSARGGRGAH